ncbi:MAG TPA: winged helix-turn-helix domain-containing protein [Candidatus Nanoarchaeia archaeon]|nr:winged helix-turn-helix domain-containing protein [Candidatus Nanoarchaeia archaeon]
MIQRNIFFITALLLIIFSAQAFADTFYADSLISIDSAGMAIISGRTNHPALQAQTTDKLTSKKESYWTFNLSLPEDELFSDYVFTITLPEGSAINYVKAENFRIETGKNKITVTGTAKDSPFSVIIQYQASAQSQKQWTYFIIGPVFLFFAVTMIYFTYLKFRQKQGMKEKTIPSPAYDPELLTPRQQDIMKIIVESRKAVSQARICEQLDLPKSSVSRNIDALVRKGLLKKDRVGMSTMLSLKDFETFEKENAR